MNHDDYFWTVWEIKVQWSYSLTGDVYLFKKIEAVWDLFEGQCEARKGGTSSRQHVTLPPHHLSQHEAGATGVKHEHTTETLSICPQ